MEPAFWHERWALGRTGFHAAAPNPRLLDYAELLLPEADGSRILVPLCGKSLDLRWLAERGHEVVGVELSAAAIEQFFEEQDLQPQRDTLGPFTRFRCGNIQLLEGDIFDLHVGLLGPFDGAYDRAALVALPPPMRQRYAHHLASVLQAQARVLLLLFEYPLEQMTPPPFSVSVDEVRRLYGDHFSIEHVEEHDALSNNPRLGERGLRSLREHVLTLRRR